MEMHQLRYFQAIAELKHYGQAAERLHVSQPALTKAIHKLEQELDVALFIRSGRSIDISVYGLAFLPYVERALKELEQAKKQLQGMKDPLRGTVRLAFLQSIGTTLLPNILRSFREAYKDVTFDLVQCSSKEALDLLERGDVDLCLITNFSHTFDKKNWVPLKREQLYGYCAHTHELAQYDRVPLAKLASYDFVGFKDEQLMQQQFQKWCRIAGFNPNMVFQGTDVPTVAGLISSDLGISILPYYSGLEALPVHRFTISDIDCARDIGLAWKRGNSLTASSQLFVDFTSAHKDNETPRL